MYIPAIYIGHHEKARITHNQYSLMNSYTWTCQRWPISTDLY